MQIELCRYNYQATADRTDQSQSDAITWEEIPPSHCTQAGCRDDPAPFYMGTTRSFAEDRTVCE